MTDQILANQIADLTKRIEALEKKLNTTEECEEEPAPNKLAGFIASAIQQFDSFAPHDISVCIFRKTLEFSESEILQELHVQTKEAERKGLGKWTQTPKAKVFFWKK